MASGCDAGSLRPARVIRGLGMYRNFLSVGGFTALSRLTGFARDLMIGAVMGVGPLADAFVVALRLPNQFRAIFGEGAFNSAYVPTYSRVLVAHGRRGRQSPRQPRLHPAADLADRAARRCAGLHRPTGRR